MIQRILLSLLAALFGVGLQAQTIEETGGWYGGAIPVVCSPGKTTFADVRNTQVGPPWYSTCPYKPRESEEYKYTQGKAVFYRMETAAPGDVIIHNWNSRGVGYTTLFLLRPALPGETEDWYTGDFYLKRVATFEELDFMSPDFDPVALGMPEGASWGNAYLRVRNLPAGTYYIVAAGYKYSNASVPNGQLGTTIITELSTEAPGEPSLIPELPNNCPVQYNYDSSGNRTKNLKKQ